MSAPEALTYDSLVTDIINYCERGGDDVFVAQVPRIIMLAESRLATEVHGLGFKKFVTGTLTQSVNTLAKPERWRETASFSYINPSNNKRVYLKLRSYEYCRTYAPDASVQDAPKFYADYDYEHFLIVATPAAAYSFELSYYERPVPLSTITQTNWTTQYNPQLMFYATLLEAQPFLKNYDIASAIQPLYDRALAAVAHEDTLRLQDAQANRSS